MLQRHLRQTQQPSTNKPMLITIGFLIAAVLAMGIYLISDKVSSKNASDQALMADEYSRMGHNELRQKSKQGDPMAQQEAGRRSREVREALQNNARVLSYQLGK